MAHTVSSGRVAGAEDLIEVTFVESDQSDHSDQSDKSEKSDQGETDQNI